MQVSQRFHNNTYAPGIATYGVDGKPGDIGLPGTSMFFTDFELVISNNQNTQDYKQFIQKITSRMLPLKNKEIVLNRKYVNGDLFVTRNGDIYMLTNINELSTKLSNGSEDVDISSYFEHIGSFDKEDTDSLFNNQSTDIRKKKLVLTDSAESQNPDNFDALLTLQKVNTGNGTVDFMNLNALYGSNGNMNLKISYDNTLKAFKLESKYPIVIDSNVYVKSDTDIKQTTKYAPVLTNNNSITNFYGICSDLKYDINSSIYTYNKLNSSTLYYGCVYAITIKDTSSYLNTLIENDKDLLVHIQNKDTQDFQNYRTDELTYYFKQDYDIVQKNEMINKVLYQELNNLQLSLIYNIEIYLKKDKTNLSSIELYENV